MGAYRIAVVSRLTGLPSDTIRKWESRHRAVAPARDRKGIRRYTDADVKRLRDLRAATELGYPIGEASALKSSALERVVSGEAQRRDPPRGRRTARRSDSIVRAVMIGLRTRDGEQIDRMLSAASRLMMPHEFVFDVVSPLFGEVGDAWRRGDLTIDQEHLFSAVARSVLGGQLRRFAAGADAPAAIFTTLPGDPHEFGVLSAAMLAASQGWRVHYLGPNIPILVTARAAREFKARVVVIGAARTRRGDEILRAVEQLGGSLDDDVEVWFGGKAPARLTIGRFGRRIIPVPTLQDFYARVRRA